MTLCDYSGKNPLLVSHFTWNKKVTVWPIMLYVTFIPFIDLQNLLDFIYYFPHCSHNPILASLFIKFNKHVPTSGPLHSLHLRTLFSYSSPLGLWLSPHCPIWDSTSFLYSQEYLFLLPSFIYSPLYLSLLYDILMYLFAVSFSTKYKSQRQELFIQCYISWVPGTQFNKFLSNEWIIC